MSGKPIPEEAVAQVCDRMLTAAIGKDWRKRAPEAVTAFWMGEVREALQEVVPALTAAQQQGQEIGGEVIQRHVVTKYRDGSVHVADVAAAECPHDWGQDEAHEDWARCYRCGTSRRKPIAQQPEAATLAKHQPCGCVICTCEDEQQCQGCGAKHCGNRTDHPPYVAQQSAAEPRSTHRAWRRNDWLLSYFEALSDHHIDCEQPAAVDNEENQRTWQALWLVLRQTGTVVVPGSDIVSADWSRCQIEQTVHDSTGAVQFRATLLTTKHKETT